MADASAWRESRLGRAGRVPARRKQYPKVTAFPVLASSGVGRELFETVCVLLGEPGRRRLARAAAINQHLKEGLHLREGDRLRQVGRRARRKTPGGEGPVLFRHNNLRDTLKAILRLHVAE